jgi:hypothetical protein
MPKELKPGWIYIHNDNPIGLEYAIHEETGWVYFEDGVKYSPEEIKILKFLFKSGDPISKSLHTVKKVFQGEIVRYEQETNDKRKSDESGNGKDTNNDTHTSGKIPETTRSSSVIRPGELDIY